MNSSWNEKALNIATWWYTLFQWHCALLQGVLAQQYAHCGFSTFSAFRFTIEVERTVSAIPRTKNVEVVTRWENLLLCMVYTPSSSELFKHSCQLSGIEGDGAFCSYFQNTRKKIKEESGTQKGFCRWWLWLLAVWCSAWCPFMSTTEALSKLNRLWTGDYTEISLFSPLTTLRHLAHPDASVSTRIRPVFTWLPEWLL